MKPWKTLRQNGFTFIEVMVALAILSFGLMAILQTFVVSMDRMTYLTNRLYASILLDSKLSSIQRVLRVHHALPFELKDQEEIPIGLKKVVMDQTLKIGTVPSLTDIFAVDLTVSWKNNNKNPSITNSAYIAYFADQTIP